MAAEIMYVARTSTPIAEQGFIDVLEALGRTVTRNSYQDNQGGLDIAALEAADLVIFSNGASSDQYDATPAAWNGVTTPIVLMSSWVARNNRWLWVNSNTVSQSSVNITITATVPAHPFFEGALDGSNQANPFMDFDSDLVTGASGSTNGTVLATVNGAAEGMLTFSPVSEADAGSYTATYDDGAKAVVTTPPFQLTVSAEGTVPVSGLLGLAALVGGCALGGAASLRVRKK